MCSVRLKSGLSKILEKYGIERNVSSSNSRENFSTGKICNNFVIQFQYRMP